VAESAKTAGSLDHGRIVPVDRQIASGAGPVPVFADGGLTLSAGCATGQLTLTAQTQTAGSIAATGLDSTPPIDAGGADDEDFNPGDSFDIAAAFGDGDGDQVLGSVVYHSIFSIVSGELWLAETAGPVCTVYGNLIVGTP
jgi:hypothetical protein